MNSEKNQRNLITSDANDEERLKNAKMMTAQELINEIGRLNDLKSAAENMADF